MKEIRIPPVLAFPRKFKKGQECARVATDQFAKVLIEDIPEGSGQGGRQIRRRDWCEGPVTSEGRAGLAGTFIIGFCLRRV
jgi:hypothetical protein